jgi:hypothetical protein
VARVRARARTPPCFALRCASSVHILFIHFSIQILEYSVGLYGQNDRCFSLRSDACTCCCETEGRRLQSAPQDVFSAHWIGLGTNAHSREAWREALARVYARRVGIAAKEMWHPASVRVIALCVRGVLDGPSCPIQAAGIELRLDEIDVDHL